MPNILLQLRLSVIRQMAYRLDPGSCIGGFGGVGARLGSGPCPGVRAGGWGLGRLGLGAGGSGAGAPGAAAVLGPSVAFFTMGSPNIRRGC